MAPKIDLIGLGPASNGATRIFVVELAAGLTDRGWNARPLPAPSLLAGHDRPVLLRLLYWYAIHLPVQVLRGVRAVASTDVLLVQRAVVRPASRLPAGRFLRTVRALLRRPCTLVLHLDDRLDVATGRPMSSVVEGFDLVLTGNDEIAATVRACGVPVAQLPGPIAVERYSGPRRAAARTAPVIIGWVGTDVTQVERLLAELGDTPPVGDDVAFRVVGPRAPRSRSGIPVDFVPWHPERRYSVFADLDVGIMPLEEGPYARGKEGYKIKEYMAAGLPVVATDTPHNRTLVAHGETGILCVTTGEWRSALSALASDPEERERLGENGRRQVQRFRTERVHDDLHTLLIGMLSGSASPQAYVGTRPDVTSLIAPGDHDLRVLDVGCSDGSLVRGLRSTVPVSHATGVEYDPDLGARAMAAMDRVLVDDAVAAVRQLSLEGQKFDCVVLADVLEHLPDPWGLVERIPEVCAEGAQVVISLPHAGHLTMFTSLLAGRFPRRDRGLFDATHLRWFGERDFLELCEGLGVVEATNHQLRLLDVPTPLDRLLPLLGWPRRLFRYQLIARVRVRADRES
ncbi:MAG: methyltransferase domain-containing protein [Actinomycetes bacterium]